LKEGEAMGSENEHMEHVYLTDDRDLDQRTELVVRYSPSGDYYIGSRLEGDRILFNGVRICTRGGASSSNPKLVKAVQDLFQALGGWNQEENEIYPEAKQSHAEPGARETKDPAKLNDWTF
jgi:hypothetical protein